MSQKPPLAWETEFCARAAESASAASDFLLAMVLWERVYSRTNNVSDMVRRLECARLAGCLQFYTDELWELSSSEIVSALTPDFASELLQERDDVRAFTAEECATIFVKVKRPPRQISVRKSTRPSAHNGANSEACALPLPTAWDMADVNQINVLDDEYVADVPEIGETTTGPRLSVSTTVRPGGVVCLSNVAAAVSSDVMYSNGRVFGDYYTWPDALNNRPTNDSRVADVRRLENQLVHTALRRRESVKMKEAIWLAYPQSWAWGHWVPEILTRYAYLSASAPSSSVPVIVDSRVPGKSLDFLRLMNPDIRVLRLPSGTNLDIERLWLSPSRSYGAHNPRWSADEIDRRVAYEPQSFTRVRQILLWDFDSASHRRVAPDRVYLDRSLGEQLRDLREGARFEEMARQSGFVSLDPGALTAKEQVSMFASVSAITGLDGSGWFLAVLAPLLTRCLIVGHDLSRDSRGRSWILESCLGEPPAWVVGRRRHAIPGYGDAIYHQEFVLDQGGWSAVADGLASMR